MPAEPLEDGPDEDASLPGVPPPTPPPPEPRVAADAALAVLAPAAATAARRLPAVDDEAPVELRAWSMTTDAGED